MSRRTPSFSSATQNAATSHSSSARTHSRTNRNASSLVPGSARIRADAYWADARRPARRPLSDRRGQEHAGYRHDSHEKLDQDEALVNLLPCERTKSTNRAPDCDGGDEKGHRRRTRRAETQSRPDDEWEDGISKIVCDSARCWTAEDLERQDREQPSQRPCFDGASQAPQAPGASSSW